MTLDELIAKWNGKSVEVAGSPGAENQCVDLANLYIRDVLHLPLIEWTNAIDFPKKAGDKYEWIPNTLSGVPSKGDLVIFDGKYGHISIFISGNATSFTSFDQNYPTGTPAHIQNHTYVSPKVIGWLHPKGGDSMDELDICKTDRDINWNIANKMAHAVEMELNPADKEGSSDSVVRSINAIKGNSAKVDSLEKQLSGIEEAHKEQVSTLTQQLLEKDKLIENLRKQQGEVVTPYIKQLKDKDTQIGSMAEDIKNCKLELAKCQGSNKISFFSWLVSIFRKTV